MTVHLTGAGSCTVTAGQSGDANFNAAPSIARTFAIAKASQTIAFPAIADSVVGATDFDPGATASSGLAVTYGVSGPCSIVGGKVHIENVGKCTVTASQPGNSNYNAAADVVRGFAIKSSQTIAFAALSARTFGEADFVVSAVASSGLPVSFAAAGNCTVAVASVHLSGAGACTVTASQAGDTDYFAASDVAQTFSIAKASQSIVFDALPNRTFGEADFPVAATASSGLAASFAAAGSCTVTGSTVHLTGAGSCTVTASQPGNANYEPAPGVVRAFSVAKASQSISFATLAGKTYGDADFAVGASASSGLAVAFAAGGNCTVGGGTVHITGAGSCTLTASQPGNASYEAAAAVTRTFAIAKAGQVVAFGTLAPKTFGDADFSVGASASSGLPTTFQTLGNCTVTGATVGITGAGSCTVTASQSGDANYGAAPPVSQTFAIAKAGQTITFAAILDKTIGDADFAVSASASSGLAVSFTASGSCTVAGSTAHLTGAGSCTITASQPGDANFATAAPVSRSFSVKAPLKCRVPEVLGKRLSTARLALKQRHCRTGTVGYAYSRKVKKGRVTAQSRIPGRVLAANAKVNLVVSRGGRSRLLDRAAGLDLEEMDPARVDGQLDRLALACVRLARHPCREEAALPARLIAGRLDRHLRRGPPARPRRGRRAHRRRNG